uniref:DNA-directed RNA polymerase n=1 Tax=Eutreptia sp. CCAC 1914B TaxID=2979827 RepID=A0A977K847_9EUGL|nr:RNA polymerase beta'' subunit [Eutreptia sp. CCAC 1914B]
MEFFFCNTKFSKKEIQKLILWFLINHGTKKTSNLIDKIKTISFQYATKGGFSIGIEDLQIPNIKSYLIKNTEKEINKNENLYLLGGITSIQRLQKIIDIWNTTNEILTKELLQNFRQNNTLNPVYIAALSGARGNISQVKQLVGMRGLMSDSKGEIIDLPIQSNFKEGLNITEYLISCYGARKGLIDTALRTSNSGYLTRKLVDVAQSLIITQLDCKTLQGILVTPLIKEKKTYLTIKQRLIGRILATSITGENEKILASKGQDICNYLAKKIIKQKHETTKIYIRSPLTCSTQKSICQLCYGWNLAYNRLVEIGETVGVIAAQSIGEPGTQLTMRTFHTGGVFYGTVKEKVYSPHAGTIQYFVNNLKKETKTRYGEKAVLTTIKQNIYVKKDKYTTTKILIPAYSLIYAKPNTKISKKEVIAEISTYQELFLKEKEKTFKTVKEIKTPTEGQVYIEDFKDNKKITWVMNGKIMSYLLLVKTLILRRKKNFLANKRNKTEEIFKKIFENKSKNNFYNSYLRALKIKKSRENKYTNIKTHKSEKIKQLFNENYFLNNCLKFQLNSKKRKTKNGYRDTQPEIKKLSDRKQCLLYTKQNKIVILNLPKNKNKIGKTMRKKIKQQIVCGQIIEIQKNKIVLRQGSPHLTPKKTQIYFKNGDIISKNNTISYTTEKKSKTGDIVQGLPKIEELLEAKITKNLQPLYNSPHKKLKQYFFLYKKKYPRNVATKKSIEQLQKFLLENIQLVYQAQNIRISDKHLEIIIKQMTSRVIIYKEGDTNLLIGEKIELYEIEKINKKVKNKAEYEPILQGITKSSLETESFISASSFQETIKILTESAIRGKIDWLSGLKENVIIGRLIPAGTGIKNFRTKQKSKF